MEKNILILDEDRISRKIKRMAFEIWEHNSNEKEVHLVGIAGAGLFVAQELARNLKEISPLDIKLHSLKINKKEPLKESAEWKENLDGKSVVLIDDVANSGKTLLYAMKPMLDFELKKIRVAVLVDRKHKAFPVSPDIVGHTLATTLQEHIEVIFENEKIAGAYLL